MWPSKASERSTLATQPKHITRYSRQPKRICYSLHNNDQITHNMSGSGPDAKRQSSYVGADKLQPRSISDPVHSYESVINNKYFMTVYSPYILYARLMYFYMGIVSINLF